MPFALTLTFLCVTPFFARAGRVRDTNACPDIKNLNVPSHLGEAVGAPDAFGKHSMAENVVYLGEGTFGCVYGLKSAVKYWYADGDVIVTYSSNIKKAMHLLFMVYHDGVISVETDGWHKFVSPTGDFSLSPGMDVAACEKFIDTLMGSIVDRALEYARQGAFNHDLSFKNALFNEGYPQNPSVVFVDWGNSNVIENLSDTSIAEYKELARQYIADLAMVCSMQDPE